MEDATLGLIGLATLLGGTVGAVGIAVAVTPRPPRGCLPPPLDRPGTVYTCRCWLYPVRVGVLAEDGNPDCQTPVVGS
ncbi:hypothetical protein SUDANB171_02270 [Streptomyces sp. enrichment culture]|jgi:hypothetical protein|uniref:hypothetical protein n=1 Tax=Streptomyces xiamenensis TaxID=408015 RepID=UPI0036E862D3